MVAKGGDEDLGFMLKATKGFAMDNAVSILLKGSSHRARGFRLKPALG
jgi:hypothetical protein